MYICLFYIFSYLFCVYILLGVQRLSAKVLRPARRLDLSGLEQLPRHPGAVRLSEDVREAVPLSGRIIYI